MTEQPTIRQALAAMGETYGPFEVAVITAPEEFVAERGVRRLAGAYAIELGVVAMKGRRQTDVDTIENIGDLTLVLTQQTATALHSFLSNLLDPATRPRRAPSENLLPIIDLPDE